MNIGIDLDGVLFDTEATFKAYSQVFDLKNGKYGISFPEELRVQKRYPWPKDVLDKFFNETLFQVVKDAQFMPMSKQVLNAIAKRNKIYIITNRGSINPQKEIEVTNERLKDSPFPYEKILFSCTDKLKVCQEFKIDIMIEDLYENVINIANGGIKCFYYRDLVQKFINHKNVIEVNNWGDIAVEFEKMGVIIADDIEIW